MLRNATLALRNFCRGKPHPDFELVRHDLPALARLMQGDDEEVLFSALWAIAYCLEERSADDIDMVVETGVCQRLVELLMHPTETVMFPALRAVGNIVTGADRQTQMMIDCGVLPCLLHLLTTDPRYITNRETCWILSYITAGTNEQIQAVIDAHMNPTLGEVFSTAEAGIKKEAAWTVCKATLKGLPDQIEYLVSGGVILSLCDLMRSFVDDIVITASLEGLDNILKMDERERESNDGINPYVFETESAGGLELLTQFHEHEDETISNRSVLMLEAFFRIE